MLSISRIRISEKKTYNNASYIKYFIWSGYFFLIGIIQRLAINFFYLKELSLDEQDVFKTGVISLIAAVAGGTGSWIFAKMDERKARKSPPSDPQ